MTYLVIGGGGREHALAWKLAESDSAARVLAAPGNGGTARERGCENVPLGGLDPASEAGQALLLDIALREQVDLTLVGPEAPLAAGIVDRFRERGLAIVGPDKKAAALESSKIFAKAFMEAHGVRTARSRAYGAGADGGAEAALADARAHFEKSAQPLVVKADGLAAGKGVVVAEHCAEALEAISAFMETKRLGEAGSRLILEEFLDGEEVSVLAALSAQPGQPPILRPFVSSRDHKRRYEGARGPNTGGMGAIAPAPGFGEAAFRDFLSSIALPTLRGIEAERMDYRGFLFFGLMVKDDQCALLEYNVRLGDPETQAVLPLMDADFGGLCLAIVGGGLADYPLAWKAGASCAPVAVAEGYPGPTRKGDRISVDESLVAAEGARVFYAGAADDAGGALVTSGGRVLAVSALGADLAAARGRAYRALEGVRFAGMGYRTDIGAEQFSFESTPKSQQLSK
jgi:phosphoribosylamine--glycine ligase